MRSLYIYSVMLLFSVLHTVPGEDREYSRKIPSFTRIEISGRVTVNIDNKEESRVNINIKSGSIDDIEIDVSGDTLFLRKRGSVFQSRNITVNISSTAPLNLLSSTSGALVRSYRNIFASRAEIRAEAGSSMDLFAANKALLINCGRNSSVKIKGTVENIEARVVHGGELDAQMLQSRKAYVYSYTGSIARVNASDYLDAGAGAGSYIYYNSSCAFSQLSETLGGKYIEY